ncbi:hypothetical protein GCM10007424_23700 [Flavobacterium suaedae]|uniref:HTH cro/C1-type domain-containing protein n=1 Tax=Flavobacterium suaedae TaxID=1767027 RepID=A0ABQ1K2H1_9FLAO|nr:helix-turn-helix domain-containing protein [Flavobacterium suaedae]GGB82934.1 hypothetical protein GCM10007424_23700 [Flavobacterium suaedae]
MARSKEVQKEYAKTLFVNNNFTQKEIAKRVGVTEKTLSNWIKKESWQTLKKSMLTTKESQLSALYDQLENINNEILTRPIQRDIPDVLLKPVKVKDAKGNEKLELPPINPEDFPIRVGNVATTKDADVIAKITASINRLETEASLGDTVEVCKKLIQFAQQIDNELAKKITDIADAYITSMLK